ncbi:MAG TPA: aldo/keto reductase [Burkholderiales bacterium]|nr:aldo/keto reductase [Burkholderiales bacterium]
MNPAIDTTIRLNDGVPMPRLGLGVYQITPGGRCKRAVDYALKLGYRHIDTASFYGNEADVGRAVRESGLPREQVFVTTKLWNSDQGYASAIKAGEKSLRLLGLNRIDLYLIHWPEPRKRHDSWRALAELRNRGVVRSIGVSNYTVAHLEELMVSSDVVPAVNQVEFNPFLYQRPLLDFCTENGIALIAYCPLARAQKLHDPRLKKIAAKHRKTTAQIMIRWTLQQGVGAIPKSSHPERIKENAGIFDFALDEGDMAQLDALDEGYRTCWDPTNVR